MNKTAIVIGSGFGGLSAAIRLQALGLKVIIVEKRDQPGGRAYVYRDKGFTFDAGPTVITAPSTLEDLFHLHNKKMSDYVKIVPVAPFYRLFFSDGYQFDYTQDMESTLKQIQEKNPEDVEGYQNFLKYSQEVFKQGYEKLAHVPFINFGSMLKAAPQLIKLQAFRSVYSMVSKYVKDEHLREAFSFHSLLVGGSPFKTSSIYTLIHFLERNWGVHFPMGGTGALVQALVKLFKENGGQLYLNSETDQILTENGKTTGIKLKDGQTLSADYVVSNADVVNTYKNLLRFEDKAKASANKITKMNQSMSLFLIYFGTNRTYPELAHHNVIFGPRYKGLLEDIFKKGILPDDFSLYLHAPTRTDASLAPAGCESFYVLSPVSHLGKSKVDWVKEAPIYADKILQSLEKRLIPDLRKHIVTTRLFTPNDFETELLAYQGAAFSLEPTLTQSAYFRVHNVDKHIKGLYFVGAGTHPGAGVPGVLNSAKATAQLISESL